MMLNNIRNALIIAIIAGLNLASIVLAAPSYLDQDKLVFKFGGGFEVTGNAKLQLLNYESSSSFISKGINLEGIVSDSTEPDSVLYIANTTLSDGDGTWENSDKFYWSNIIDDSVRNLPGLGVSTNVKNGFFVSLGINSFNGIEWAGHDNVFSNAAYVKCHHSQFTG